MHSNRPRYSCSGDARTELRRRSPLAARVRACIAIKRTATHAKLASSSKSSLQHKHTACHQQIDRATTQLEPERDTPCDIELVKVVVIADYPASSPERVAPIS